MNIVTQTVSPFVGLCFVFSGYVGMMSVIVGCKGWGGRLKLACLRLHVYFFVCVCPFSVACHCFLLYSKDLQEHGMFSLPFCFIVDSLAFQLKSSFLTVAKSLSPFPVSRAAYKAVMSSAVLLKRNHHLEPHV